MNKRDVSYEVWKGVVETAMRIELDYKRTLYSLFNWGLNLPYIMSNFT